MACGCKKRVQPSVLTVPDNGQTVLIEYQGAFRLTLRGPVSHRDYGTHHRGDRFHVLAADVNHSPHLFKVVA